jgi:predicted alpha/beta superfamily hydrolase
MPSGKILFVLLLLVVFITGCQTAEPVIVEVPVEVEVTRIVEVPVEAVAAESPSLSQMMPVEFDRIASNATGREYALTISLPLSYGMSETNYPVVYVTDGDIYALPLGYAAGQMAFGSEIPEVIVVGVDYGTANPMEWMELRDLDMGPEGSPQYLQFFEEELIPYIESSYRAEPSNRTLAGHSSGGDFALYALFNGSDSFHNFIASSAGVAHAYIPALENMANEQDDLQKRIYLSIGDQDMDVTVEGLQAFGAAINEMAVPALAHKVEILDNETHLSARPRAFNNGMRWIFSVEGF